MKRLLKSALRVRKRLSLFFLSICTLLILTVVNQAEMISFGILAERDVGFFQLFDKDASVSKEDVQRVWPKLDVENKGYVVKSDAQKYLFENGRDGIFMFRWLQKIKSYVHQAENKFSIFLQVFLIVGLIKAFFLFYSRYLTKLLAIKISKDLRQQYFKHIQSLPMKFFQQHNVGSLSSRVVNDAAQISLSINSLITNYIHTPFVLITSLTICFMFSWQLTLIVFIGLPSVIYPIRVITRRVKRSTRKLQKNQEDFSTVLLDFLSGIQVVKIFSMQRYALDRYREKNDEMEVLESKISKYDLMTRPILHFMTTFCLVAILMFGLFVLYIPLMDIIVFCGLLHLFYEPVKRFADENANVQKGVVAAERLYQVLDIEPDQEKDKVTNIATFKDHLKFERVWFKYAEQFVLSDVSFSIRKGESIALVGATGSGKSTIAHLIPNLYQVDKGRVVLDGLSVNDYSKDQLRSLISIVPQRPFLFCDTILANLTLGKEVSLSKVKDACRKAHALEFIEALEDNYYTQVAEGGRNFSGGQLQRLSIARALLKESSIMILDEATSALDSLSEHHIREVMKGIKGELTQIIIAHRLSTIEHVDRIILLGEGKVLDIGTLEELLDRSNTFRAMHQLYYNQKPAIV